MIRRMILWARAALAVGFFAAPLPSGAQRPDIRQPNIQQPGIQQPGNQEPGALQISLVGAWIESGTSAGHPVRLTLVLRADGTYLQDETFQDDGARSQQVGHYSVQILSPTSAHIAYVPTDWMPKRLCNDQGRCIVVPPPRPTNVTVDVVGPDAIRSPAGLAQRGPASAAVQAPVPDLEIVRPPR